MILNQKFNRQFFYFLVMYFLILLAKFISQMVTKDFFHSLTLIFPSETESNQFIQTILRGLKPWHWIRFFSMRENSRKPWAPRQCCIPPRGSSWAGVVTRKRRRPASDGAPSPQTPPGPALPVRTEAHLECRPGSGYSGNSTYSGASE